MASWRGGESEISSIAKEIIKGVSRRFTSLSRVRRGRRESQRHFMLAINSVVAVISSDGQERARDVFRWSCTASFLAGNQLERSA